MIAPTTTQAARGGGRLVQYFRLSRPWVKHSQSTAEYADCLQLHHERPNSSGLATSQGWRPTACPYPHEGHRKGELVVRGSRRGDTT